MNTFTNKLGFIIPNSDLIFEIKRIVLRYERLFIISKLNEILVVDYNNGLFEKKYLMLQNTQERDDIKEIFILNKKESILESSMKNVIVTISSKMNILYWDYLSGICYSKVNITKNINNEKVISISNLDDRFILFILAKKFLLFDSFTQSIPLEYCFQYEDKNISKKDSCIISCMKVKNNKFFLITDLQNIYFLNIKLNSFTEDNKYCEYEKLDFVFYKSTFDLMNKINIRDDSYCQYLTNAPTEALIFTENCCINYSYLDTVEDISVLTKKQLSTQKSKVIFISEIIVDSQNYLIVILLNLQVDIFSYDKKIQELKMIKSMNIMIESTNLEYNFLTFHNSLIIYYDHCIFTYEFTVEELLQTEDELKESYFSSSNKKLKLEEKYNDYFLDLNDCFDKKIYFTNYFKDNFSQFKNSLLDSLNKAVLIDNSDLPKYSKNEEKYKKKSDHINRAKIKKSLSITNTHYFSSTKCLFQISCSNIFINSEDLSIYYVIGLNNGLVLIFEIFFTEEFTLNNVYRVSSHKDKITFMTIYENSTLIISSQDGLISFIDVSKKKLNSLITDKPYLVNDLLNSPKLETLTPPNVNDNKNSLKFVELSSFYSFFSYFKLKRIIPIIVLDSYSIGDNENLKKKNKSNLGFVFENNNMIVINIETTSTLLNLTQNTREIIGAYIQVNSKLIMVLLDNYWLKICSYASRSVDRVIKDIESVYKLLRVDEKFKLFFADSNKIIINEFETQIKKEEKTKESKQAYDNYKIEETNQKEKYIKEHSIEKFSINHINSKVNHIIKKSINNRLALNLPEKADNQEEESNIKTIFYTQFYNNLYQRKKIYLNVTNNKFDVLWLRVIEDLVIDKIYSITIDSNIEDKLKRLKIFNLLYYPVTHFIQTKDKLVNNGINSETFFIGNQIIQSLDLDFVELFYYLERLVVEMKNNQTFLKLKHNFFNLLSLMRIWNISMEQDSLIMSTFKIFSPIFEFFIVAHGVDCTRTIMLTEEEEVSGDGSFSSHYTFLTEKYFLLNDEQKHELKGKDKLLDSKHILSSEKGYITNFKLYTLSNNVSHLLNSLYFGCLISILGYDDGPNIAKLVSNDKMLLRSLSLQKYIKFSNLTSQSLQLFDLCENISLACKDILITDYLIMKINLRNKRIAEINSNGIECEIDKKFKLIKEYLNNLHFLIFKGESQLSLSYFNKETLTELPNEKYLSEFDLLLIYLFINYHIHNHTTKAEEETLEVACKLLILFIFKILKNQEQKSKYSKVIVDLISKSSNQFDILFKESSINYVKLLMGLYTSIRIPIDINSLFKKYDIGNCSIIKSEDNLNFLKIMIAKIIKTYAKSKANVVLKFIVDEFKHKHEDIEQYNYMMEIVWILFKDRSYKHIHYLPSLISLLMTIMNPNNKELRICCLENCKTILALLLPAYPMLSFHQSSQRLAVGATDGKIFIYDITTGSLWKSMNAHGNEISAVLFDSTGNILISYSSTECNLKFWKIGLTGFITSFFGMKDGHFKIFKYDPCEETKTEDKLNNIKLQLMPNNKGKVMLVREDLSTKVITIP